MKKVIIIILLLVLTIVSKGQINILSDNDNFSYLKADSIKKIPLKIKFIPVTETVNVSFGGEIREQLQQVYKNEGLGKLIMRIEYRTVFDQLKYKIS